MFWGVLEFEASDVDAEALAEAFAAALDQCSRAGCSATRG